MNQDKLFIIGVGGTGMRCLESFVHLCAIGMFDNREIEILTLDTDQSNGNKIKTESLIELYNRIKSSGSGNTIGVPNSNTFFSAKLNIHKFWTNYQTRSTYRNISHLAVGSPDTQRANQMISDLFLDKNSVQEFNLAHGFRAQTHLGSHLIYHSFIEAARNLASGKNVKTEEKELEAFINKLMNAASARVFVFGSIFGGTGASSIPVLPKAFEDFIKVRSGGNSSLDFTKSKFGSTLLTEYFTFRKPDSKQMESKADSVIADSHFFPLNSLTALQFYQSDPTVQKTYKIMYHIGWPIESKKIEQEGEDNITITGGDKQKNPAHITELLSACAAYDFFTKKKGLDVDKTEYLYRAIPFRDNVFNFSSEDFIGKDNKAGDKFADRLGAFFSLAHIVLTKNEASNNSDPRNGIRAFISRLEKQKITTYRGITDDECNDINLYMKYFAYSFEGGRLIPGWLYQVRSSVAQGSFIFNNNAFSSDPRELKNFDVGKLFKDSKNHWDKGSLFSDRYSKFIERLIEVKSEDNQRVTTPKEKLLAHIFNAITKSQKFN